MEYTDTESVFVSNSIKRGDEKNVLKCASPTHALPIMPLDALKFLNAICTPYMGA